MRFGSHHNAIALFLLFVAVTGMATSQPTSEMGELLGLHPDGMSITGWSYHASGTRELSTVANPKHQESSDTTTLDDDSLCWCGHMLPGFCVVDNYDGVRFSPNILERLPTPNSPPKSFFHPPRLI